MKRNLEDNADCRYSSDASESSRRSSERPELQVEILLRKMRGLVPLQRLSSPLPGSLSSFSMAPSRNSDMALLLVMGLPAAGKSTLCRQLTADCRQSSLFSLDDIIGRQTIPDHAARKRFEKTIRSRLEELATAVDEETAGWHLVTVDDNLYLKSMRRPFERMARRFGFSFLVAVVPCSLQEALRRNSQREGEERVAEETIRMMNDAMEISDECEEVKEYKELLRRVREAKRLPPRPAEEDEAEDEQHVSTTAETNETALRRSVQRLVKDGYDGKRLSIAKKAAWEEIKGISRILSQEKLETALKRHYWLVVGPSSNKI